MDFCLVPYFFIMGTVVLWDAVLSFRLITWEEIRESGLVDLDFIEYTSVAKIYNCKLLCLRETVLACWSLDYAASICSLSNATKASHNEDWTAMPAVVYSEYMEHEKGVTEWKKHGGHRLVSHEDLEYKGISLEVCQEKCEDEVEFVCRSITFSAQTGNCILSRSTRAMDPSNYVASSQHEYHQPKSVGNIQWIETENSSTDTNPSETLFSVTLAYCKERCLHIACSSLVYGVDTDFGSCKLFPNSLESTISAPGFYIYQPIKKIWGSGQCLDDEWQRREGFCYLASCEQLTFSEAKSLCQSYEAQLASIHSLEESLFVSHLASSLQTEEGNTCPPYGVWIGLVTNNFPNFFWLDGTPFDYDGWHKGVEPNNRRNDVAGHLKSKNHIWGDAGINDRRGAICKMEVNTSKNSCEFASL